MVTATHTVPAENRRPNWPHHPWPACPARLPAKDRPRAIDKGGPPLVQPAGWARKWCEKKRGVWGRWQGSDSGSARARAKTAERASSECTSTRAHQAGVPVSRGQYECSDCMSTHAAQAQPRTTHDSGPFDWSTRRGPWMGQLSGLVHLRVCACQPPGWLCGNSSAALQCLALEQADGPCPAKVKRAQPKVVGRRPVVGSGSRQIQRLCPGSKLGGQAGRVSVKSCVGTISMSSLWPSKLEEALISLVVVGRRGTERVKSPSGDNDEPTRGPL